MKNIIYNSLILGALLISTQSKAQHLLEALDASFFSSTQNRSANKIFTRNNCSIGYSGGTWDVQRTATATVTSVISQTDADNKAGAEAYNNALAMVNAEGQIDANSNASCVEEIKQCWIKRLGEDWFTQETLADCRKRARLCSQEPPASHLFPRVTFCIMEWDGIREDYSKVH